MSGGHLAPLHPEVVALLTRLHGAANHGGAAGAAVTAANLEADAAAVAYARRTQQVLATPPGTTTLRVNTARLSRAQALAAVNTHFANTSGDGSGGAAAVTATAHPVLDDVLTVPCTGPHHDHNNNSNAAAPKRVLVDQACGCSVLRGAGVFAMGVVRADATVAVGDAVSVWMLLRGGAGATTAATATATATVTATATADSKAYDAEERMFVGNGVALLSGDALNSRSWRTATAAAAAPTAAAAAADVDDADGVADSTIASVGASGASTTSAPTGPTPTRVPRGCMAVRMTAPLYRTPSCYALEKGTCTCGCTIQRGTVLLQNVPSVVAVHWLAPRAGERVLDMCAAPGGKTSHIAQLMTVDALRRRAAATASGTGASRGPAGVLVAAEKHPLRAAALKRLLKDWALPSEASGAAAALTAAAAASTTGPAASASDTLVDAGSAVSPAVHVLCGDALTLAAAGAVKMGGVGLGADATHAAASAAASVPVSVSVSVPFAPASFDRILLDPPCSGLGQRPHFRSGSQTLASLRGCALYQRKLLRVAHALLRPAVDAATGERDDSGVLVFSTCTLSPYENEANVCWFLRTFPDMQLCAAPATATTTSATAAAAQPLGAPALAVSAADLGLDPDTLDAAVSSKPTAAGAGAAATAAQPLLTAAQRALCQRFDPVTHDTIAFFVARFRKVQRTTTAAGAATAGAAPATAAAAAAAAAVTDPAALRAARAKRKAEEKQLKQARATAKRARTAATATAAAAAAPSRVN